MSYVNERTTTDHEEKGYGRKRENILQEMFTVAKDTGNKLA